jgi:hypothetical protein
MAKNIHTAETNGDAFIKFIFRQAIPKPTRKIKRSTLGVSHDHGLPSSPNPDSDDSGALRETKDGL